MLTRAKARREQMADKQDVTMEPLSMSDRIDARPRYAKRRKRRVIKKRRYTPAYQVYKPVNLRAGRLTGRGDYWSSIKQFGTNLQRYGQKYIPKGTFEHIGNAGWGSAGAAVGRNLSSLVGFGDYYNGTDLPAIRQNSLINMGSKVPSFIDMNHATIITHKEFVADVVAPAVPGNFNVAMYSINPGISATFPWLSTIARNYDQYELIGCVFYYKSTSSDSANTLPMGTVIMATNYDSSDATFANKQQMQQSEYSCSMKPSEDHIHPLECAPNLTAQNILYLRTTPVSNVYDLRQTDLGNFGIATAGLPAGTTGTIGELWVSYNVALIKPKFNSSASPTDIYSLNGLNMVSGSNFFGYIGTTLLPQSIGAPSLLSSITNNVITIPPQAQQGYILVKCAFGLAAPFSVTAGPTFVYTNMTTAVPPGSTIVNTASSINVNQFAYEYTTWLKITNPLAPATIQQTAGGWVGLPVGGAASLVITLINTV